MDARGATGGGSRALTYEWGVLTDWDAETTEEADSVIALQREARDDLHGHLARFW